jgi:hypothetical protein
MANVVEKESKKDAEEKASKGVGQVLIEDDRLQAILAKLSRYETSLMNAFIKTERMLSLIQRNRNDKTERWSDI